MEQEKILEFKNEQEKETAKKIIRHLITTVKMMEQLPQDGKKEWSDGCITGMKQLVWGLIYHLDDPEEQAVLEKLLFLFRTISSILTQFGITFKLHLLNPNSLM